ncbi:hypothetical protein K227x_52560 [Rubripirellula lacrimiformis]|uniref:DUF368 domain-containing protein n=1 Tax=Rubripirellula lacrimiformis TaxID=1930273 RepID=A0A517NI77_9BACT|nr:DUF368 domain-containing protein [Rubripirellula lacrimiformis]QDT06835.1 hypothetical protein K227x_52560 [Rubripirellula lacrimiformis]
MLIRFEGQTMVWDTTGPSVAKRVCGRSMTVDSKDGRWSKYHCPVCLKEALMEPTNPTDPLASSNESMSPIEPIRPVETVAAVTATPRNDCDTLGGDVINVIRGFCMGAADTVPGVSGGTVALILGHYTRLITAISHVDSQWFGLVKQRRLAEASRHLDLRFLVALGFGILAGVATLSGLMHWLLEYRMPQTLAVFLGLLVASVWIVHSYVDRWTPGRVMSLSIGAAVAVVITLLPMGTGNMSLPYLFFSAAIAICAMILPGISGAFVLLLLGVYHGVTGLIKDAARGNFDARSLVQIAVFAAGCLTGLLAFSRLLRYLLLHHRGATMAWLMGLMIGSVGKLWPLQRPTAETASEELKFRVMEYVSPSQWDGSLPTLVALAIGSAVAVLVIERFAGGQQSPQDP